MRLLLFLVWGWLALPALVSPAPAAAEEESKDSVLWVEDEHGLRQWKAFDEECTPCRGEGKRACQRCSGNWKPEKCSECKQKKIAPCRTCAGSGRQLNPLEEVVCPYCQGSAHYICSNCNGGGSYVVDGGSRKGQKCGPCKGSGLLECEACKGKRAIAVVKIGKGPGKAKASQLESAREVLNDALVNLRGYKPWGRESDDRKVFDKAIKKALSTLPALKQMQKMRQASMKALRVSAAYVSYESEIVAEFKRFRGRTIKLLEGQIELIDACAERLEFNAKKETK